MQLIIISGLSGSGKTVALRALEDRDYYCVDNIPLTLLCDLVASLSKEERVAISVDIRNFNESGLDFTQIYNKLSSKADVNMIYLESNRQVLLQRYSDSRRRHPLAYLGLGLQQSIDQEIEVMLALKEYANLIIDTTTTSNYELSDKIFEFIGEKITQELQIQVQSFGFKYGLPLDSDYVFDVRFLPNPYWEVSLRGFSGNDPQIIDYFAHKTQVQEFIDDCFGIMQKYLGQLEQNSRSYLTISIGCTGGKHRSVYVTNQLAQRLKDFGKKVTVRHLNLEKTKA